MRPVRLALCVLLMLLAAACASRSAAPTPQRLPTRAPAPTATPTSFSVPAWTYYQAGLARQRAGDVEAALEFFTWAVQRAPDFAPAYVARGTIYLGQGNPRLALVEADAALEADPASGAAYALRGEALRLLGRPRRAEEAFARATALDPDLWTETFRSRWLVARAAHDAGHMLALSQEYANAYPRDPLRHYYQGWAWAESGQSDQAIETLVAVIESTPDPPAALWFALGQAYAAGHAWRESVTAFEAARTLVQAGDTSLVVHSEHPIADLFATLGQAYLHAGRCVDAETMLEYAIEIGAPSAHCAAALEEARICQTPTPTATPYPTTTPYLWWE